MGLSERELERYRHPDDMLPSSADASAYARGALPGDVQHIYKHCYDAHRVRGTLFYPGDLSHYHRRTE